MAAMEMERPPIKLPDIQTRSIYEGRFKDRNPEKRAAGKLTATSDSAQLCMKPVERPDSPGVVRKFRATFRPDAGKSRVFYGRANDPHLRLAAQMTHGVCINPSLKSGELVNPDPKTRYQQSLISKKESLYASHQRAPLGMSHDQSIGFPQGLDPINTRFGIRTEKVGTAGELVNPDKSFGEVNNEYEVGHDLYLRSHRSYRPGEQCCRSYKSASYAKDGKFGIPTPHENDGRHVRKTLKWLNDTQQEKAAQIVSKRVDDFRERTQPQLGKVHDPIKDTLNVPSDHTFGILVKPDEYGAGDLIHTRNPDSYLRGKDRQRGVLAAIRQHLKKANYHNFEDLLAAFRFYDRNGSGRIDMADLREACIQFNLPIEPELLEQLMSYCDADKDGLISYIEFANFLNWKDKMPSGLQENGGRAVTPTENLGESQSPKQEDMPRLQKQIDRAVGEHRTSANMINAVVGGISTKGYRTYGVPTIRTDLPAPRIRRIDDRTNYGDESDAFGLVNPSIYSTLGVYEKDFLIPRTRDEIREVFFNIGVQMDLNTFDIIYNMAAERHPKGVVSVESFRNILDEVQADGIKQEKESLVAS